MGKTSDKPMAEHPGAPGPGLYAGFDQLTRSALHMDEQDQSVGKPKAAGEDAGTPIVRLTDLHKAFGSLYVLKGINLEIERGKTTVILGPSGTGKSVLLKHIVGLIRPDRGEVYFDGQRVDTLAENALVPVRKRIGYLFQLGALFDSMSVGENIGFPLVEHTKMDHAHRQACIRRVLGLVGLSGFEDKMPAELSGGQQRRVALARAVVLEPCMVLYDEPTTGLDPVRADLINELILALTRQMGITSIVVTHDIASANKIADRMILMHEGEIIADGRPEQIQASDNQIVQRFINGQANQDELNAIRQAFASRSADYQPDTPHE